MLTKLLLGAAMAAASAPVPAAGAETQGSVAVSIAPPGPVLWVTPPPRPDYLWAPGYWGWSNGRHVWLNGGWLRDRPGYAYWQPRWVTRDGHWWLQRGQWARDDRDRYGLPNPWDPDSDGVPNRHDQRGRHPQTP